MNSTLQIDTLAAIQQLATVPPCYSESPNYELLEQLYGNRDWTSPLLNPNRPKYQDEHWARIKNDERLLLLFKWFSVPLTGQSPALCPDSEIPALRILLADVSSLSELEFPEVCKRAKSLMAYLEGLP